MVILKSADPQCFKNLKDGSRPHKCSYYANKKAWMTTEVMTDILSKLNGRLKRHRRQILLFMDNAPCHPESHNINVVFLPKHTTSKTQALVVSITASWEVLYRKVDGVKNAAEIVKSINFPMVIKWGRQTWDNVASHTIKKNFEKTGLYAQEDHHRR